MLYRTTRIGSMCALALASASTTSAAEIAQPAPAAPANNAPAVPVSPVSIPVPQVPTNGLAGTAAITPAVPTAEQVQGAMSAESADVPGINPLKVVPPEVLDWFRGHGGLIIGAAPMLVVPLGNVASGNSSSVMRSHYPGAGIDLLAGALFKRRWGVFAHVGYAKHAVGSDKPESASSMQFGATGRYLFAPERKTPFVELGITRTILNSTVRLADSSVDRSAASWDLRLGAGFVNLSAKDSFFQSPYLAVDFGRFGTIKQSDSSYDLAASDKAWHAIASIRYDFGYHRRVEGLVGPAVNPKDTDGDQIESPGDQCPTEREDYYPPAPKDGCPSKDKDGDGIPDEKDSCPVQPEDGLAPNQTDGCPSSDPDQDGFDGSADKCPTLKEDGLLPKADDGCPTDDPDQDGIPSAKDQCPNQPETINGVEDEDGCPDMGRVTYDAKAGIITLSEKIFFKTASAEVGRQSLVMIGEIAGVLKHLPDVELVEVSGHADKIGLGQRNLTLTQSRADAVRDALIDRGVDPRRLTAVGYGSYCPLSEGDDPQTLEKNRRVEFRILRTGGKPTEGETSCPTARENGISGTDPMASGAPSVPLGDDSTPPSETEVRVAVAKADASLLFPDYHACHDGEPVLNRVKVLAVSRQGNLWQAKLDGLVESLSHNVTDECFAKPADAQRWKPLYNQMTTITVYLIKTRKGFKLVRP